ncbi:pyridoxal phosphate-dependent aminotransferase [Roseiflexus castenholzii]|jgi:threonine-phosphate decarboxylase|uniref:Aminotransferase class I and II n=1 Tax=Roseiflexus castenholzii (strain DSM 13941 / HLO8) TaxID=383372 RepID=A7NH11_ROSCS|nr:histidinol-phosphate transaminase [Roseiflexus castenholzii]ABU56758.1 aminotransferase class I and II [Roseiflexus castenholzii DSM 13941]
MDTLDRVVHGALDSAELAALGIAPDRVIDFSSNLNPFGPPPAVHTALATLDPTPYPDRHCLRVRTILAERHGCALDQVLAGNGTNELIYLIAQALGEPGATALILAPTYGEYEHASRLARMQVVEVRAPASDGFRFDEQALIEAVQHIRPRLIWLCAPNNPTGTSLPPSIIGDLASACDGFLVADRAYYAFQRDLHDGRDPLDGTAAPNLIRLYSLTKSYALAGLRFGYLIAHPEVATHIGRFQPAWSVNSAAQAAGLAALTDAVFLPATLPRLWSASDDLVAGLHRLGLYVWRAALPFMLVRCGNGATVRTRLLHLGCIVRDCASFGLPEWVRVAPRRPEENARLIAAWKEIV